MVSDARSTSSLMRVSLLSLSCVVALIAVPGHDRIARAQAAAGQTERVGGVAQPPQWSTLPHPSSSYITGIEFDLDTRHTEAPGSDIWPITWADDDHQYAAFGDGGGFGGDNKLGRVSMGVARVEGDHDDYVGRNVWGGADAENPVQFQGKGTGILSVDGILYMWVAGPASTTIPETQLAVSRDHSCTWQRADWLWTMHDRLFAGTFINAGRDYADAPDGYVYACFTRLDVLPTEPRSWIHEVPGRVDLARVPKDRILEQSAWEWFAGTAEEGQPRWTPDGAKRQHTFEDPNGIKVVSVCYQPVLRRYLLVYNPRDNRGNFALFEAPQPWGPWSEVAYLRAQPLFMPPEENTRVSIFHFAPKWWSSDGRQFTLIFNVGDDAWNTVRGRFTVREPTRAAPRLPNRDR